MHSFYCRNIPETGQAVRLEIHDEKHLFKTLRGKPGDPIELLDGRGVSAQALITSTRALEITGRISTPEPPLKLHLFVATPRRNPMEQMLRQCAEVGVWSITPVVTERSVALPPRESAPERWETILQEGCKQSRNPFLPQLHAAIRFNELLERVRDGAAPAFFGAPGAGQEPFPADAADLRWIVGPEGGLSPDEEARLTDAGARACRIGRWIMRVETAAVCGAALFLHARL
jgi:16S rRNA (uracil1498-N3)-methyltransferase